VIIDPEPAAVESSARDDATWIDRVPLSLWPPASSLPSRTPYPGGMLL
jgi:hypothetical protein